MMEAPKRADDYPDRALECEEALEPHFMRIVDDLASVGMSREGAARRLARTIEDPALDIAVAEEIASVRAWAVHAGWREGEVDAAIRSLGPNIARAAIEGIPD